MKAFARLLERLAFTPGRNSKLTILSHYFGTTPDPDRGYALAALTGTLDLRQVSASVLKRLASDRVDEQLFRLSYDFVGDLAETIALIWPAGAATGSQAETGAGVSVAQAVNLLNGTGKLALSGVIADLLDRLSPPERLALLKLATGNLRVGVSARLTRSALAMGTQRRVEEIEEIWHGLSPPFQPLFDWLDGGPRPDPAPAPFRPVMLSTPVTPAELAPLDPRDFIAEWKWDGIRVQAVSEQGIRKLYSRTGEEIGAAFPDIIEAMTFDGAVDGELLVRRGDEIAPFSDLQKRLGRKQVSRVLLRSHPAALRLYDILTWQGEDLRPLPLAQRRARLEAAGIDSPRIDLSPLLPFDDWNALAQLRAAPPVPQIEGVMIKRRDAPYLAGRPRGPWFKWKQDPMLVDAVLLYAQSGHGKRSGFYSDFTFGLWDGADLVPVGKAYFGFTDEELRELDRFVRKNTVQRFGPVRQLAPKLVVEVAFEGLNPSPRHRSGIAMRFPRIARIRWDKPAAEADRLTSLKGML
ncbi:cisplatin damage response ATP-dependent DNA ligase [Szabonella alba]|uniref:DNA ligase (ATP) n=1 Tax=Szabonella alba TaxID=2804194 RepID=A0A8K0VEZ2_9RHOB|nr:cisplatin damage response ATP-dependent DNA ligase [Szabonella alba]MBL4919033.1 cisplatin damage response ATP-dependent DNA ligase [Szabonella alba]